MKYILSLAVISMSFLTSAGTELTLDCQNSSLIETALYPGGPGKKGKRTNKKRKRKCAKWSRKGYAGQASILFLEYQNNGIFAVLVLTFFVQLNRQILTAEAQVSTDDHRMVARFT